MKNNLTETHEPLNTTWVSSWAIIVVLDCRPLDEDLGSRYYKRMIAMIMTIMMRRMGLMMTDSQRRDKSRLTEDLHPDAPLTGPCRTDNPHPGSRLRTNEFRSFERNGVLVAQATAICWGRVR